MIALTTVISHNPPKGLKASRYRTSVFYEASNDAILRCWFSLCYITWFNWDIRCVTTLRKEFNLFWIVAFFKRTWFSQQCIPELRSDSSFRNRQLGVARPIQYWRKSWQGINPTYCIRLDYTFLNPVVNPSGIECAITSSTSFWILLYWK